VIDLQVSFGRRLRSLRLGWGGVAGDQPIALGARVEAVAAQRPPHPIGQQPDAAPGGSGELGGDAGRTEPGVAKGEGGHSLLDELAGGIDHARHPALSRP
jgi:hypothetical protein